MKCELCSVYVLLLLPPYLGVSTLGLEGVHGQDVVAGGVQGNLGLPILTTVISDLKKKYFIDKILSSPCEPSLREGINN